MIETGKNFTSRWLKKFGLEKFSEERVREHLKKLPLPDTRDFELCEFLFCELPRLFAKTTSDSFAKTAEAYARFVFAFWQSKNAFVPFPQDYAWFLREALCGKLALLDPCVFTITELAGTASEKGECGFNTFAFRDAEILRATTWLARNGNYEDFLTETALAKYREFEQRLNASEEFIREWEMLKSLYPDYKKLGRDFVLHRRQLNERGWARGQGTPFNSIEDGFRAAFDLFCWKYYLWGMDLVEDVPLLLKPSVNVTPFGTQIFIPAYMSYDARRDFNHAKIAKLHRAKGVRRQGAAFSEARIENKKVATRAQRLFEEGRRRGLCGNVLLDFVAEKIWRPELDYRALRRLLKKGE